MFWSHNMGNFWWTKCDKKGLPKTYYYCDTLLQESIFGASGMHKGKHTDRTVVLIVSYSIAQQRDFMVADVQRLISDPGLLLQDNVKYPTPSYIDRSSEAKCVRCKSQMLYHRSSQYCKWVVHNWSTRYVNMGQWDTPSWYHMCCVPNYLNPNLYC
jgi:hypothetical protein